MTNKIDNLKNLIDKKIKISYNSSSSEISRDDGYLREITPDFFAIQTFSGSLKLININKIIRVEML